MSAPIVDVERWADIQAQKLDVLISAIGQNPAVAGRMLMVMDMPLVEARGMVAEAVIGAAVDPRVAATLRALSPVIDRWLSTSDAAAVLGPAQAEVRIWLWACCVAYGWALDAEGHARG
jgi:hypothetical protein